MRSVIPKTISHLSLSIFIINSVHKCLTLHKVFHQYIWIQANHDPQANTQHNFWKATACCSLLTHEVFAIFSHTAFKQDYKIKKLFSFNRHKLKDVKSFGQYEINIKGCSRKKKRIIRNFSHQLNSSFDLTSQEYVIPMMFSESLHMWATSKQSLRKLKTGIFCKRLTQNFCHSGFK